MIIVSSLNVITPEACTYHLYDTRAWLSKIDTNVVTYNRSY